MMAKTVDVAIALGSNLGNSLEILKQAVIQLSQHPSLTLLAHSSWYKTEPIGPPQPDYINGCAICRVSDLTPIDLLSELLCLEQQFGRQRHERWGPRTLDLDLIFYGNQIIELPELQVPHPHFQERTFVLIPLAEIAPKWRDPKSQQTVFELKNKLPCVGIKPIPKNAD